MVSTGVPVGFEYSYNKQESAFQSLNLITNRCPYHQNHFKKSPYAELFEFYLIDQKNIDALDELDETDLTAKAGFHKITDETLFIQL